MARKPDAPKQTTDAPQAERPAARSVRAPKTNAPAAKISTGAKAKPQAKTKAKRPAMTKAAVAAREAAREAASRPAQPSVMEAWHQQRQEPGKRMWEAVSRFGRNPKFETSDDLWAACVEWFQWVEDNPLTEAKAFPTKNEVRVEMFPKLRAMTIRGLCLFLDISQETWRSWRDPNNVRFREDFVAVIDRVEGIITEQKFAAASAGLLNGNIIARDLGLADKTEVTGKDGGAIEHSVKAKVRYISVPPKVPAETQTTPMQSEGEQ